MQLLSDWPIDQSIKPCNLLTNRQLALPCPLVWAVSYSMWIEYTVQMRNITRCVCLQDYIRPNTLVPGGRPGDNSTTTTKLGGVKGKCVGGKLLFVWVPVSTISTPCLSLSLQSPADLIDHVKHNSWVAIMTLLGFAIKQWGKSLPGVFVWLCVCVCVGGAGSKLVSVKT